eukprot:gnl/Ergobibamus_cyprinoides/260.p1 GENE.gnl/Ergobibamus_cyprinoides/260~~gnl/Ergobibamus_cyprinoides/260.p1  ORF type:complete len:442 (+),score=94.32 gnl/Ergobibamus_cyprinoides/260:78-1403(+)
MSRRMSTSHAVSRSADQDDLLSLLSDVVRVAFADASARSLLATSVVAAVSATGQHLIMEHIQSIASPGNSPDVPPQADEATSESPHHSSVGSAAAPGYDYGLEPPTEPADTSDLVVELDVERQETARLRTELMDVLARAQTAESDLASAKAATVAADRRIETLEAEITELKDRQDVLTVAADEAAALRARLVTMEAAATYSSETADRADGLQQELAAARAKTAEMSSAHQVVERQFRRDLERLQQQVIDAQEQERGTKATADQIGDALRQTEAQCAGLQREVTALQAALSDQAQVRPQTAQEPAAVPFAPLPTAEMQGKLKALEDALEAASEARGAAELRASSLERLLAREKEQHALLKADVDASGLETYKQRAATFASQVAQLTSVASDVTDERDCLGSALYAFGLEVLQTQAKQAAALDRVRMPPTSLARHRRDLRTLL